MSDNVIVLSTPKTKPNKFHEAVQAFTNRDWLCDFVKESLKEIASGTAECSLVCGLSMKVKAASVGFFCVCEEQVEDYLREKMTAEISKALKPLIGKQI